GSNNLGILESTNTKEPSWDEQVAQKAKELKETTDTHKEELKENRTCLTEEENMNLENNNNTVANTEQNNKVNTHNNSNTEVNMCSEENIESNTCNEEKIEI